MTKDQKVVLFRTILKSAFVFVVISFVFWASWNLMVVGELGIGKEVGADRLWIFGLPTYMFFYFLRLLSPAWFILLKVSDFLIYSVLIIGWLGLIWWL